MTILAHVCRSIAPIIMWMAKSVGYQLIIAPRPKTFIRTLEGRTDQVMYPLCYLPKEGWFVLTTQNCERFVKWPSDELRAMNWQWEERPRPE